MEITPAERITHQIATQVKNVAFWFGMVAGLLAFAALAFNMWSFRAKLKDDDEKWREERRWEKMTREEDKEEKRQEREEAKRKHSAIDELDKKVTDLIKRVTALENEKLEQREKLALQEQLHQNQLSGKEEEIERLTKLKETMQKCLDLQPLPGWLPGSPGATWGQYIRASSQS